MISPKDFSSQGRDGRRGYFDHHSRLKGKLSGQNYYLMVYCEETDRLYRISVENIDQHFISEPTKSLNKECIQHIKGLLK